MRKLMNAVALGLALAMMLAADFAAAFPTGPCR